MDVAINLQFVEDLNLSAQERAICNIFRATLQFPADAQAKGMKLANDIDLCNKAVNQGNPLWGAWIVLLDISRCIPPDHPWQDGLLQCLDNLRRREGRVEVYHFTDNEVSNDHRLVLNLVGP